MGPIYVRRRTHLSEPTVHGQLPSRPLRLQRVRAAATRCDPLRPATQSPECGEVAWGPRADLTKKVVRVGVPSEVL